MFFSENGVLFNKAKTTLIQYPAGKTDANYNIPNSVTSIGVDAFASSNSLTSIVIPNSVVSIGSNAFQECIGLTSVTIPNSVTSIESMAFFGCNSLAEIINYATTPQTLNITDSIGGIFDGVNESAVLYVPAEAIEAYRAAEVWKDFANIEAIVK